MITIPFFFFFQIKLTFKKNLVFPVTKTEKFEKSFFMMETVETDININININNNNKKPEFEIVGPHQHGSGWFCCIHSYCGMHEPEDAIKLVKIVDGTESCTACCLYSSSICLIRISTKIGNCYVVLD